MKTKFNISNQLNLLFLVIASCFYSCGEDFLEVKYDKRQTVPESLDDLQALLDRTIVLNQNIPILGEISADNFYLLYERWQALTPVDRNSYIWASDIYENTLNVMDWNGSYQRIYTSNVVLEALQKINPNGNEINDWNGIKGAGHFFRGTSFFQLAQQFCAQYDPNTATSDLGIPLRLASDVNGRISRSTVEQTYQRILDDLKIAVNYLPEQSNYTTRPSRAAAYAMLAKTHLQMGEYGAAKLYADSCLSMYSTLMDYNEMNLDVNFPFLNPMQK